MAQRECPPSEPVESRNAAWSETLFAWLTTTRLAISSLALLLIAAGPSPVPAAAPGGEAAAEAEAAPAPVVEGFRSASFGSDESAVRRAIHADFGLAGDAVIRLRNDLEQTTVLAVEVDDLVPDAGPAAVRYVLGQRGELIQVTILWGLTYDPTVQRADLEATSALLMAYFAEQGYSSVTGPEPVVFVDGSNLLFYSRDPEGGGLALSALPRRDPAAPEGAPPILRLAYSADLDNPDVFRTPAIVP